MKKQTIATHAQGAQVATNKKSVTPSQVKVASVTETATTKQPKERKPSAYTQQVIESNKLLKTECSKLGWAIKVLTSNVKVLTINEAQKSLLAAIDKGGEAYKKAATNCRKSKSSNYSPFYLLQYLYSETKTA